MIFIYLYTMPEEDHVIIEMSNAEEKKLCVFCIISEIDPNGKQHLYWDTSCL